MLHGDNSYIDETVGEAVRFTNREQQKLREVAVVAKVSGLGAHRAQAATLQAADTPETLPAYDNCVTEATLRQARWRAFREGAILSARRIMFIPRDVEMAGCGRPNASDSQQQRDAGASGLLASGGGFRGRVLYRKTGWKRLCETYEDSSSDEKERILLHLARDSKDDDGLWTRPPSRKKLEHDRPTDGFLRWFSCHDPRAAVVAFGHNASVLKSMELEDKKALMGQHLFYMGRIKDASLAVERYNRYPKSEAQTFRTGAARNTETRGININCKSKSIPNPYAK